MRIFGGENKRLPDFFRLFDTLAIFGQSVF